MSTLSLTADNTNYAAEVIEVHTLIDLDGLDNLKGLPIGGFTALVSKDTQVGDILVAFPAESQIEDWFLAANNLYRHAEKNTDPTVTGYVEDNRRVKAIRLRGHASNALTLPASVLGLTKDDVGTLFDTADGLLISKKYEVPRTGNPSTNQAKTAKFAAINLPVHPDTENWWRNEFKVPDDTWVTVSQKLHGTSIRFGRILVPGDRPVWWKRWLGHTAQPEYAFVVGSRKVIKSVAGEGKHTDHWYKNEAGEPVDLWTTEANRYADLVPDGVLVYGELIGWTPDGAPIQKGYTYNVPEKTAHLYVYRVAVQTPSGTYDLSWAGVQQFAAERGLNVVPTLWEGRKWAFDPDEWIDKVFADETIHEGGFNKKYPQAVRLSDPKTVDEGVVVRAEGITPLALKAKSPIFLGHESKILDEGTEVLS